MVRGSRYWAESFILLTSGKKLYLSNTYGNLKKRMKANKETITVETSNLYSKKYEIMKRNIEAYGRM